MVRKMFKNTKPSSKLDAFIEKYKISREYLSTNRKSVTRGLLIGTFWAFIPMPFQLAAMVACTPFVKFNVPVAVFMILLSNPLTMPFMYYLEYMTGDYVLGMEPLKVSLSLAWFQDNLDNIFIPLYTGTAIYATSVSLFLYHSVNWLWIHSVQQEKKNRYL